MDENKLFLVVVRTEYAFQTPRKDTPYCIEAGDPVDAVMRLSNAIALTGRVVKIEELEGRLVKAGEG